MEKEKPKEFPISKVMKILNSSIPNLPNNYTCDDFTVVSDATPAMASSVINFDKPYILDRPRFGILYSGIVHIELNLVNHHLESPLIVFSSDKTIMKAQGFSGDVKFAFLVPSNEYVNRICNGRVPETFSGIEKDYLVPATNEDCSFLLGIINAIIAALANSSRLDSGLPTRAKSASSISIFIWSANPMELQHRYDRRF